MPSQASDRRRQRVPVLQASPNDACQDALSPHAIVHAQRDTVGVPEIELSQIAMKMLLAAVLIDTLHTALEDAEAAFDCSWKCLADRMEVIGRFPSTTPYLIESMGLQEFWYG